MRELLVVLAEGTVIVSAFIAILEIASRLMRKFSE